MHEKILRLKLVINYWFLEILVGDLWITTIDIIQKIMNGAMDFIHEIGGAVENSGKKE
jgi:hypothetical protein